MPRASAGTPAKTRGENSATVLGRAVAQRVHAIVGQVFDELESRKKSGKGDLVALIADEILKTPIAGLERLAKLLPQEPSAAAGGVNINAMFLQAVQLANGHSAGGKISEPGLHVIEASSQPPNNDASKDEW